jgi:hypothetical protein
MSEVWLSGPVAGVTRELIPAVHALLQSAEDIPPALHGLTTDQIWLRAGGAASIGFHLQHIHGSLDRLLTYARGEQLSDVQLAAARIEREPGTPPRDVATMQDIALSAISGAVEVMRQSPRTALFDTREVGKKKLPSTVFAILFHCGEHAQRHAGQIVTTAKILKGLNITSVPGS